MKKTIVEIRCDLCNGRTNDEYTTGWIEIEVPYQSDHANEIDDYVSRHLCKGCIEKVKKAEGFK